MNSRPHFGKVRGIVVSAVDPKACGRLKVQISLGGQRVEVWAEACVPYAGGSNGFHAIPPAGAGVWVEFVEGDLNQPIWTGCWWKEGELNEAFGAGSLASAPVVVQSTGKHRLILSGGTGDAVVIETVRGEHGPRITMSESSVKISCGPTMSIEITASEVKINNDGLVVR